MINGFDEITVELNPQEFDIALAVARSLQHRVGQEKAVTSKRMSKVIADRFNVVYKGARIRKIIQYIRLNGMVNGILIADNKGYYIETDKAKINKYIDSLRQREQAIAQMRIALEKQYNKLF